MLPYKCSSLYFYIILLITNRLAAIFQTLKSSRRYLFYFCQAMQYSTEYYKIMFERKLQELHRYHAELSNYSLIDASNTLRFLLLDAAPLVDVLNREKQIPITYLVNNDPWSQSDENLISVLEWKEINPKLSMNPAELKKDAFLRLSCMKFMGEVYAVQDILKFYAYVRGGIHLDKGEEKYASLREAFQTFKLNGLSSLDHSMRGILQVVYTALSKYKEVLLA
jgi:hypothetical protein